MKKLVLALMLLAGCKTVNSVLISSPGQVYAKEMQGSTYSCALVNEWNVSELRTDKQEVGCWCQLRPIVEPGVVAIMVFQLFPDEMCQ